MSASPQAFALDFVPRWYECVRDPRGGVFEGLGLDARPLAPDEPKTTLVQARTVFALAHLALATGEERLLEAAREVHRCLDARLRDADGGYRFSTGDGPGAALRRSYDQSFVLLALTTLRAADPSAVPQDRIDAALGFLDTVLTDPSDGSLHEDDAVARTGARAGDLRGQNPHMHLLEACLQGFEAGGQAHWMERAAALVALARHRFVDPATGAVREFAGHDLSPACGAAGARREPGHQYEWAWLLHRHADLCGQDGVREDAARMVAFAERHGLRADGPLAGAPFEALDAQGRVVEETHLLWPLTEAGKLHAALFRRTGDEHHRRRAEALARIVFSRFFAAERPVFANRLGGGGETLWPQAPSRLVYHVALLVTQGERAGLWSHRPPRARGPAPVPIPEEERS